MNQTLTCAECGNTLEGDPDAPLVCPVCDAIPNSGSVISNLKPKAKLRFVEGNPPRRTIWLWFYTYIRLPLGALAAISAVDRLQPNDSVFAWIAAVGAIAVAVGLHRRTIWGWQLNWIFLLFESTNFIKMIAPSQTFFSAIAVVAVVWLAPNSVYFYRRRHLFDSAAPNRGVPADRDPRERGSRPLNSNR